MENRKSFQQWCCWVTAGQVIGNGVMPLNCWVCLRTLVRKPRQRMARNASLGYAARHYYKAKHHSLGVSGLSGPLSKAELENSKVTLLNKPTWKTICKKMATFNALHPGNIYSPPFPYLYEHFHSLNWYSYEDAKALKYSQVYHIHL